LHVTFKFMTTVMPVVPVYDLWLKHVVIHRKSHVKSVLIIKSEKNVLPLLGCEPPWPGH